jgi:hypothetical protein
MEEFTVEKLIEDNGGVTRFAERMGLAHNTVSEWKSRGKIPAWRAQQVSHEFQIPLDKVILLTRRAPVGELQAASVGAL